MAIPTTEELLPRLPRSYARFSQTLWSDVAHGRLAVAAARRAPDPDLSRRAHRGAVQSSLEVSLRAPKLETASGARRSGGCGGPLAGSNRSWPRSGGPRE